MAINARGMRDPARGLQVSPSTVLNALKKRPLTCKRGMMACLRHLQPEHVEVALWRAEALEVCWGRSAARDEMWSGVHSKAHPRWVGHAIEPYTDKVLAYGFGR